jgi:hypothetical protein
MTKENHLAKLGYDHALFLLFDILIDDLCSLLPKLIPFSAFILENSSSKELILLSHLFHEVEILSIRLAQHRLFK